MRPGQSHTCIGVWCEDFCIPGQPPALELCYPPSKPHENELSRDAVTWQTEPNSQSNSTLHKTAPGEPTLQTFGCKNHLLVHREMWRKRTLNCWNEWSKTGLEKGGRRGSYWLHSGTIWFPSLVLLSLFCCFPLIFLTQSWKPPSVIKYNQQLSLIHILTLVDPMVAGWWSRVCLWPQTSLLYSFSQAAGWGRSFTEPDLLLSLLQLTIHYKLLLTPLLYWLCSPVIYLSAAVYTAGGAAMEEPDGDKYLTLRVYTVYWRLLNIRAQTFHIQGLLWVRPSHGAVIFSAAQSVAGVAPPLHSGAGLGVFLKVSAMQGMHRCSRNVGVAWWTRRSRSKWMLIAVIVKVNVIFFLHFTNHRMKIISITYRPCNWLTQLYSDMMNIFCQRCNYSKWDVDAEFALVQPEKKKKSSHSPT